MESTIVEAQNDNAPEQTKAAQAWRTFFTPISFHEAIRITEAVRELPDCVFQPA